MSQPPDSGGPDAVSPSAHPPGLSTLFFTEMWERFSYYGMRALLVLFMTDVVAHGGLGMTVVTATALYGLYTFAVYAVALPGGWIADRLTGQRQAVLIGGVIIAVGHLTLAIPTLSAFYLGLALIVVGTGLLKPSVSAIVADLYPEGGARRDAGFSIFYMGINVGALAGPLVCGTLGERVNWHLGFSAAGVGMIFGVVQYVRGWRHLGDAGLLRQQAGDDRVSALRSFWWGTGVVVALVVVVTWLQRSGVFAFSILAVAQATGTTMAALVLLYFAYIFVFGRLSHDERRRVAVIPVLFVAAAVFWSGYEQTGSSLNLFADGLTNRMVLGMEVPTTWLQSVNPLFIILLAPVVGALWVRLGSKNPSIPAKFTYGLLLLGLGFLVLAWGATFTTDGLVSPMWLVVTYFFHTVGELCLSPVGLSSITKLSPKRLVGQMMGIWFMATALGSLFAGLVAGLVESLALPQLFGAVGLIVIGGGVVMLLASGPVRRLAGDVR